MTQHDVAELLRELTDIGVRAVKTRGGGHYKLVLPNGRCTFMSGTPSGQNALHKIRAAIKRKLREGCTA